MDRKGNSVKAKVEELKLPPQSLKAEQSVLGAILRDESALPRVFEVRLSADDFYREAHGLIFTGMQNLFDRSEPVDLVTLSESLHKAGTLEKIGGPAYLAELADAIGTAANVEHYARIVREKAVLRRLITASGYISEQCYATVNEVDQVLDDAEREIFSIRDTRLEQTLQAVDSGMLTKTIQIIEDRYGSTGSIIGVPTGFKALDQLTSGFQPSDLIVIAGRPSMGKTALALNIAMNAAIPHERDVREGSPSSVAFFSLEMSQNQILMRLLCSLAQIDLHAVRTGRLRGSDFTLLTEAATKLSEAPIYIDDSGYLGIMDIRAKARRLKSRLLNQGQDLGMILIDYLQLVRGSSGQGSRNRSDSREQEISEISRSLKALAKELNVPVVALSQLNRQVENRPDKRPILADLRESGAIEQDADVIAFVFREELYKPDIEDLRGKAELRVSKQRNGPTGVVPLTFLHQCARFRSAAVYEAEY
ncbi:MAG: replicative DNA helicase [Deltaproteobacteria bacterium]|nr:replicative DNA helicase [Deltaproteobacteria bacterium]MBW2050870.1 replicative DNA helicase [Deltaproteobacteria bacterium]MBW2140190.1 replicative DNA helicase [Deltaproteobacteria bacterium]